MIMKKLVLVVLSILFMACHSKEKRTLKTPSSKIVNVDKKMDSLYNTQYFNGFSATVVDTSGIIYNKGFGFLDIANNKKYTENTVINIASISKVFIGASLLKADEIGFLSLDEPINKYLPFEIINPNHPEEVITIRQLATHTSSIIDSKNYMETCYVNKDDISIPDELKERYESYYKNPSSDWVSLSDYMKYLLKTDERFYSTSTFSKNVPGEVYDYSNIGAALCALVIENASKKSFKDFTQEYIFKPLKMDSTTWEFENADASNYSKLYYQNQELPYYKILSYPDGGLITSSTDLGLFLVELIKGYSGKGTLLTETSYQEFFKSQLPNTAFKSKTDYNVGLFMEKELKYNVIGHSGGDPGVNSMMYFDTEKLKGRILILNTDSDEGNNDAVYWDIWNTLDSY